jgi:6-phosphogluconolactonase
MVASVHGSPKPPPTRVTMTFPAINAAREVWVLAAGTEKQQAVHLALVAGAGPRQIPAAGVHGRERTMWMLDEEAAALLPAGLARPGA